MPGLLRPNREGALRLHLGGGVLRPHPTERAPAASMNRASSVLRALLAFCVNQGRSSPVLSLLSFRLGCHSKGTPGSAGAGPRHQKSVSGAGWVVSLKSLIAGLVEEWRGRCEPGVTDVDR